MLSQVLLQLLQLSPPLFLRGEAGCPTDPVLVPRVVPGCVLAELDGMAFEE